MTEREINGIEWDADDGLDVLSATLRDIDSDLEREEMIAAWMKATQAWRPIETAPTDGTEALLYEPDACKPHRPGRMFVGWWQDGLGWTDSEGCHHGDDPTHWLPLPEPPEGE